MKKPVSEKALLCEFAWEVCNKIGGIYTVVRSKVPRMSERWGTRYCLLGPYKPSNADVEFDPQPIESRFEDAAQAMREQGLLVHTGRWLVSGHPQTILLDIESARNKCNDVKHRIWKELGIDMRDGDPLVDEVILFGYLANAFLQAMTKTNTATPVIAHFHEWMAATAISFVRNEQLPVRTVFTTHATQLGRFLAMDDPHYLENLPQCDWQSAAQRYNMEIKARLERAAAKDCDVLTTVSEITAHECTHLFNRTPDVITPNGLNISRFTATHEFQNLHRNYKEKIHNFVRGHFFPSYNFNLSQTVYLVTSGRYEYTNKGFDLTLEAAAQLNRTMRREKMPQRVVLFLITQAAYRSMSAGVLHRRGIMEEIRKTCESIRDQVGDKLFDTVAGGQTPDLNKLVDEYWWLRLRRGIHAWQSSHNPPVVTHDLSFPDHDAVLNKIKALELNNCAEDPVKIVYHPDFVTSTSPLIGMDYEQFVRGCHLGVFPCMYEPWGYAPMECVALGIPAVTSDMAGFGTYVQHHIPEHEANGIHVLPRRRVSHEQAAAQLTKKMLEFVQLDSRKRIALRNRVENLSDHFAWKTLINYYMSAYEKALTTTTATGR